ncbi:MAG: winged helix-turn-helix transcriptional regulator [Tissierellales bacterium]|jgi:dihydroxyacetone kinase|nr:winged helix-turn-helix transcriptional regulator [Tissierellales bacterium]
MENERYLLIEIAVMYYLEGKTQNQIAKELYISRPKVSRMLKKAKELGVVDISINYDCDMLELLQNEIKDRFGIHNVMLVKTLSSYEDTVNEIGKMAAKVLIKEIRDDMTIGISWGHSVRSTVSQLKKQEFQDLKVVELFGAISYDANSMLSIGRTLTSKLGGKLYPLPAPIYINNDIARDAVLNTPVVKNTLDMIDNCDLVLSGLGALEQGIIQTVWDEYIEADSKDRIKADGGVGFLCAHFFDQNGKFLDIPINHNIIGISTEKIKEHKLIVVAGGLKKAKSILGALRGGYIDTLISDEDTLKEVLRLAKNK